MAKPKQALPPRVIVIAAILIVALGALIVVVNRLGRPAAAPAPTPAADAAAGDALELPPEVATPQAPVGGPTDLAPMMTLQLFVVDGSGRNLITRIERIDEPPTPVEQVRATLARLAAAPDSPVPAGVRVREIWVANGIAYLDFPPEVRSQLRGGSLEELIFVYGIVGTLSSSVASVGAVQFLIGGQAVDTLNGHTDLSLPVEPLTDWVF